MITQKQIDQHDRYLESLVKTFSAGLIPLFADLFLNLRSEPNPTRIWIQSQFQTIINYTREQFANSQALINSNSQLLESVLGTTIDPETQSKLSQLILEAQNQTIDQILIEQTEIIDTVMFAVIAGLALDVTIRDLFNRRSRHVKRIVDAYRTAIRNFDATITILRGRLDPTLKYKYVGGIIKTTRSFCAKHNNKTYTVREIETIWRNSSWGGKAPGNPFIVRGGWNCRHMFVPVRE